VRSVVREEQHSSGMILRVRRGNKRDPLSFSAGGKKNNKDCCAGSKGAGVRNGHGKGEHPFPRGREGKSHQR